VQEPAETLTRRSFGDRRMGDGTSPNGSIKRTVICVARGTIHHNSSLASHRSSDVARHGLRGMEGVLSPSKTEVASSQTGLLGPFGTE